MSEMTRRKFLHQVGALALGTALGGCGGGSGGSGSAAGPAQLPPDDRPNILLVLTDDLAWDAVGHSGRYPFLATPNIDRLAAEGARFTNAFVTTSLCSPSRASLLTGLYASRHGVRGNDGPDLPRSVPTFPQLLQQSGYATGYIGKWHMGSSGAPRPGFDYWLGFEGQGTYEHPYLNENGRVTQHYGYLTDILTEAAAQWVRQPRSRPFCLVLSHKAVHSPFTPPPRHAGAFAGAALPEPANFRDTYEGKPEWLRRAAKYGTSLEAWQASEGLPVPDSLAPWVWDPYHPDRLNYLRLLLSVDDSVGTMLNVLEEQGVLDRTAVIFTSDNGYFLGEHRRGDKRLLYEESIRVPLLVRYPELVPAGATIDPATLNIDLAPTLLDLAGLADRSPPMQGNSFLPLFSPDFDRGEWRTSFLCEYFKENWLPGIPNLLGVRTERWKYIVSPDYPDDLDELYDLVADPIEMVNLSRSPDVQGTLAELKSLLMKGIT